MLARDNPLTAGAPPEPGPTSGHKPRVVVAVLGADGPQARKFTERLAVRAARRAGQKAPATSPQGNGWFECEQEHRRLTLVVASFGPACLAQTGQLLAAADGFVVLADPADPSPVLLRGMLQMARQAGVQHALGYVRAAGDPAAVDAAEIELRAALQQYDYPGDDVPVVRGRLPGGCEKGERTLNELLAAADLAVPVPEFDLEGPLFLPVQDLHSSSAYPGMRSPALSSFHAGRGRILRGRVKVGEWVEVAGSHGDRVQVRVHGLSVFGREVKEAQAGDPVYVVLHEPAGGTFSRITRGANSGKVIASTGSVVLHRRFAARLRLLPPQEGGRHRTVPAGSRPRWLIGPALLRGTLLFLDGVRQGEPGQTYNAEVRLDVPYALAAGMGLSCQMGGKTVAVGAVERLLG